MGGKRMEMSFFLIKKGRKSIKNEKLSQKIGFVFCFFLAKNSAKIHFSFKNAEKMTEKSFFSLKKVNFGRKNDFFL
jgi:hypothetical protein